MAVAEDTNRLDFTITKLEECRFHSPPASVRFIRDDERVLYHSQLELTGHSSFRSFVISTKSERCGRGSKGNDCLSGLLLAARWQANGAKREEPT